MRILMTTDSVGGVWQFTQELVSGLLKNNCAVALVSFGWWPKDEGYCWAQQTGDQWGDHFRFIPTDFSLEWMQENQRAYEGAANFLLDLAGEFRAELIHSNQYCFGALPTTRPKVITAHSDVLSWAVSCHTRALGPALWLEQYSDLVSKGLAGADFVAAPTAWMLGALSKHFLVPSIRRVIPNCRTVSPSSPLRRKLQAVTAGRLWDKAKNVAMLEAVESSVPLFAAGDISCESSTAPILQGVHLLGRMSEETLLTFFCESAIYICTSKYEPFGLAPLEAALCGCAVLANDIASLREVWGSAALYFRDAASLSILLDELSTDSSLLASTQKSCLQRAVTFSNRRMTADYLALYQEALARAHDEELVDVA